MIKSFKDLAQTAGCFPRLAHVIVQVDHVMAGFIAMCILAYQARYVRSCFLTQVPFYHEKRIELLRKCLFSPEKPDKTMYIVRYKPGILPGFPSGKL